MKSLDNKAVKVNALNMSVKFYCHRNLYTQENNLINNNLYRAYMDVIIKIEFF
jgi:hypothetical protein